MTVVQNVDVLIATLNTIEVGALDTIRERLLEVRRELETRELGELAAKIDEAMAALERGDLADFRRAIATVVSRLGHLR